MAILDPSGINPGQLVQYIHVKNLYDALNGDGSYDIVVTGDFTVNSGAITGGTINATSFVGSGLSLTGVITDTISASFATTASFNTFTGSYYTDSASFASRIVDNDNDITNLFVASQSLNTQQNALQAWSSSIVLDYLGDVQTVGAGFAPLNGNVLVYDGSISKFRPSRNSLTVNITGSTIFKGDTEVQGFLTADNALFSQAITASSNISSSATVQGLTGSFGRLEGLSPITVGDELIVLRNITSSANISSSLDVISRTGSFDYVEVTGNISGSGTTTLQVGGDIIGGGRGTFTGRITGLSDVVTPKILNNTSANGGTVLIDDGLTVSGHLTASIISSSGDLSAVTGSFSHLTGNSPITVGSPTKFLQSVTGSIISASSDIQGGTLTSAGNVIAGTGAFVVTDNIRSTGPKVIIADNVQVTGNVTASQDISASGDLHGAGLIVEGTGRITGSLFVSGSSTSVDLIPEDRFLVDSDNITLSSSISFNISGSPVLDGNLTASGAISASGAIKGENITTTTGASTIGGSKLEVTATTFEANGNAVEITVNETTYESPVFDVINSNIDFQTSPITASHDISSSATVYGLTGSFSHLVGNSPITVGDPTEFLQPVTASIITASAGIGGNAFLSNGVTFAQFDAGAVNLGGALQEPVVVSGTSISLGISGQTMPIILNSSLTASGTAEISGSLRVNAVTGSFSCLEGNSPITVVDPITFQQSVTASVISASSAIVAPGIDIAITEGSSADSNLYGVNGRKVTMKNQLQSTLADGDFATFTLLNTDIEAGSIVLGAFTGNTTQSLSVGSIISVTTIGALTASVQIHNETGQSIPDDTGFTASFVIM